jgi:hypothetical protein
VRRFIPVMATVRTIATFDIEQTPNRGGLLVTAACCLFGQQDGFEVITTRFPVDRDPGCSTLNLKSGGQIVGLINLINQEIQLESLISRIQSETAPSATALDACHFASGRVVAQTRLADNTST